MTIGFCGTCRTDFVIGEPEVRHRFHLDFGQVEHPHQRNRGDSDRDLSGCL
jgi:hypothetical protein